MISQYITPAKVTNKSSKNMDRTLLLWKDAVQTTNVSYSDRLN